MDETPDTQDTETEESGLAYGPEFHDPEGSPICDTEEYADCTCREFI